MADTSTPRARPARPRSPARRGGVVDRATPPSAASTSAVLVAPAEDKWVGLPVVAARYGVSEDTVRAWRRNKSHPIGRLGQKFGTHVKWWLPALRKHDEDLMRQAQEASA